MKNAIQNSILFMLLSEMACFSPPSIAATSDCEDAYFSPDDFNHERPLLKPHLEFMKSYKLAKAGNAMEQRNVAVSYDAGYLVTACPEKAYYWYQKAANNGDPIAQDWVTRNNTFTAMFDGPESVGLSRPQVAFEAHQTKDQSSPSNDAYDLQVKKQDSLAGGVGDGETVKNKKVVAANMTRLPIEPAQPLVLDRSASHDVVALAVPLQDVKGNGNPAQEQHLTPIPPTPTSDSQAASTGETASQSAKLQKSQQVIGYSPSADELTSHSTDETTDGTTSQSAKLQKPQQAAGYSQSTDEATSHLTDETTSHSTRLSKNDNQVAGYNPAKDAGEVIGYKSPNNGDQVAGYRLSKNDDQVAAYKSPDNSDQVVGFKSPNNGDISRWLIPVNSLVRVGQLKNGNQEPGYDGNTATVPPSTDAVLDISLEHAIDIAKEASFRLGRSRRYIDGTLARYKATSSMYLPRLDSSVYGTQSNHQTPFGGSGMPPQFGGSLNLTVTQPLDIGGIIGHQVTQAELARRAAEYDLEQSHLDVSLEVEINYYNALRAQEIVRVDMQFVKDLELLAKEIGETSGGVSNFIQVELANSRQTLTSSRTTLDLSFDTLKQSLRLVPGAAVRLTDKFSYGSSVATDNVQALREALAKRPDIGQIGVRIEQTRLAAEQVSDARKPTLNLQLFAYNSYFGRDPGTVFSNPMSYDRGVMLTFNMPIVYYDWGYLSETKRAALLQNEQALFDLQEQRERVGLEVRQAVIALKRAEQRVNTLPDLARARDALRRAESDFLAAGKRADPATLAQMSNARASSHFAETVTIDALYEYNIAIFNLKHAIGTLPQMAGGSADGKLATFIKK